MNVPFKIYEGESIRLSDLPIKEGNLIICKDTKQIFADLKINNTVTRFLLNSNEIDLSNYETIENAAKKLQEAKDYTDEKIKDLPAGGSSNVAELIAEHNSNENAHEDIRNAIPTKTSDLTNDSNFITSSDVDTKISALVDSAPETLDTLNELAAALGDNPNFATTITEQIGNKVDKIEGKGLSTNDYTTEEKEKLAGLMVVNPNLFINWYFPKAINQRGLESYTGDGYTIDRWKLSNTRITVKPESDGLLATRSNTGTWASVRQYFNDLEAGTYTVSFLVTEVNGGTCSLTVYKSANTDTFKSENKLAGTNTTKPGMLSCTFNYTPDASLPYVAFTVGFPSGDAVGVSFKLLAAKLELGSTQTLAHQDASGQWVLNEIPNYQDELLKCCMSTADSGDDYANNKKTPAAINAVNKSGDTMTSTLSINSQTANTNGDKTISSLINWQANTVLRNQKDSNNYHDLWLSSAGPAYKGANEGTSFGYELLHTGNKNLITPADIGITGGISSALTTNFSTNRAIISNENGKLKSSAVTSTELGYLDGVTSAIQTQLNGKQATLTGAATTVASSNLTASRALVSNSSGKIAVSAVTSTELGYLDGVTSAIQTQLDDKAAASHNQAASTITAGTFPATGIKAKTGTDYTTARIRNIQASTTDLTAGTSTLASGNIYLVYE